MARYEIHVNSRNISENTELGLKDINFCSDPFLPSGLDHTPTNHFTWQIYNDSRSRGSTWDKTLSLLEADNPFQGYAESETVSEDYSIRFDNFNNYNPSVNFPINGLSAMQLPKDIYKTADIHVKRSLDSGGDSLDNLLEGVGFYNVDTPRNRIFTLHTEWIVDAKTIFGELEKYFIKSGGVKGMEMEVVSGFYRSQDFPLASAIPKGQANYLRR